MRLDFVRMHCLRFFDEIPSFCNLLLLYCQGRSLLHDGVPETMQKAGMVGSQCLGAVHLIPQTLSILLRIINAVLCESCLLVSKGASTAVKLWLLRRFNSDENTEHGNAQSDCFGERSTNVEELEVD
jgi:hypothetical protein